MFSLMQINSNISLYTLSCPKLKFRYYLSYEIIIEALKPENSVFDAKFKSSNPIIFYLKNIYTVIASPFRNMQEKLEK